MCRELCIKAIWPRCTAQAVYAVVEVLHTCRAVHLKAVKCYLTFGPHMCCALHACRNPDASNRQGFIRLIINKGAPIGAHTHVRMQV